jgi:hypothetical protein
MGFDTKFEPTPMNFGPTQRISMWPQESVEENAPVMVFVMHSTKGRELHTRKEVGLLLNEDEAMHILAKYPLAVIQPPFFLTDDLKNVLFQISEGHVGCMVGLVRILEHVPVSIPLFESAISNVH